MKRHDNPVTAILALILLMVGVSGAAWGQEIIKSPLDAKDYRYLVLDNGLRVLLVSDNTADKAAASLDVHVGSGSDPENRAGLAHFLEHMLFLGTEKYPEAGEYQAFIKNNGGSDNAYTSFDHTNYYFSIPSPYFAPALDRFSRFFIDPTFDARYVAREREVVHSEYRARMRDESRRARDALKTLLNPDHPASRFAVGSLETLADRDGESVRQALIAFFERHYSANIMTLAVLAPESLDELERLVRQKFSAIINRNASAQAFDLAYWTETMPGTRLDTRPEKLHNSVNFQFLLPSTRRQYRAKPVSYIANILGHEGTGSLLAELKRRGLAESLSAGHSYLDDVVGVLSIRIGLTENGVDRIAEIGDLLFAQIRRLRQHGVARWRFEEQAALADLAFKFAQETDTGRLVRSLAARLHRYEPQDVLRGPYMMTEFDAARIEDLLDRMQPATVFVQVISQNLTTDRITQYYATPYAVSRLSERWLARWAAADEIPQLALPQPNPFIPQRLELLALDVAAPVPARQTLPSGVELWYRADHDFATPRANFYFTIQSPVANANARDAILTELYVRSVNDQLSAVVYPAYLADLSYSLYRHQRGFSVKIEGFEDRQPRLLAAIINALRQVTVSAERFAVLKDRLARELRNVDKESPANQSVHEGYRLLMKPYWTESERLEALMAVQLADLPPFIARFYAGAKARILAHGDIAPAVAVQQAEEVATLLENSTPVEAVAKTAIRRLDSDTAYLRTMAIAHPDSALARYFQGRNNSREERALVSLLSHLMAPLFYHDLRTINRVGYLVYASTLNIDQTPGLLLSVQSPSHAPQQLNRLYTEFLGDFRTRLATMPEDEYQAARAGLVDNISRRERNLAARSARYWREIDLEQWAFDAREKQVAALNRISRAELLDYFDHVILDGGGELLVQSAGGERSALIDNDGFSVTGNAIEFRNRSD